MAKKNNFSSESIRQAGKAMRAPLSIDLANCEDEYYANMKIKEIAFKSDMNDAFCDLILSAAEYIIASCPTEDDMKTTLQNFCDFVPKHRQLILEENPDAFCEEYLSRRFQLAINMERTRIREQEKR